MYCIYLLRSIFIRPSWLLGFFFFLYAVCITRIHALYLHYAMRPAPPTHTLLAKTKTDILITTQGLVFIKHPAGECSRIFQIITSGQSFVPLGNAIRYCIEVLSYTLYWKSIFVHSLHSARTNGEWRQDLYNNGDAITATPRSKCTLFTLEK